MTGPAAALSIRASLREGGLPLLALTLLGALLRFHALDEQAWLDELLMLKDYVRQPLGFTLTHYLNDNHHPLYTVLASLSAGLLGDGPAGIRLPAALFGTFSIALAYGFARIAGGGRGESFLVAGLLACAGPHVTFSQNARAYTALLVFTVLATWSFRRACAGAPRAWIIQGVSLALGTYCHLTGVFVGVAEACTLALCWGWNRRRQGCVDVSFRQPLLGIGLGALLALVLHAPMLSDILAFFSRPRGEGAGRFLWSSPTWSLAAGLDGLGMGSPVLGAVVLLAGLALGIAGLASFWKSDRVLLAAMLLPAPVGAATMLLLSRNLWPRFFFASCIFALVIVVRGLLVLGGIASRKLARPDLALHAGAFVLVLLALATAPRAWGPKQDHLGARAFVETAKSASDPVATAGLATWAYEVLAPGFLPIRKDATALRALADRPGRSWVLYVSPIFMQGREPELWKVIQERYEPVRTFDGTMAGLGVVVCRER